MATNQNHEFLRRRQNNDEKGQNLLQNASKTGEVSPEYPATSQEGQNGFQNASVGPYRTAAEYSQAVQQWLWQYHSWNQMNMVYMTMPMYACSYGFPPTTPQQPTSFPGITPFLRNPAANPQTSRPNQPQQPAAGTGAQARGQTQGQTAANQGQGELFKIPPLWKRVFAEFIDFFLLFIVKLAVTIFFVEYIGLVDLRHYDLEYLMTTDMDYNMAFAMTSELVAMEIVNRVFICIFETLCLRKGVGGMIGGTTPGKRVMGLKVISCREVTDMAGNIVRVLPASNIGTWNAFVRTVIKNFSLAFFFPVCLTVFFFQHNRAAYDIISNCIVVEGGARQARDRQARPARR